MWQVRSTEPRQNSRRSKSGGLHVQMVRPSAEDDVSGSNVPPVETSLLTQFAEIARSASAGLAGRSALRPAITAPSFIIADHVLRLRDRGSREDISWR